MKKTIDKLLSSILKEDVALGFELMRTQLTVDEIYSLIPKNPGRGWGRPVKWSWGEVKYFCLTDRRYKNKWVVLDYEIISIDKYQPYKFGSLKMENLGNHEYKEDYSINNEPQQG